MIQKIFLFILLCFTGASIAQTNNYQHIKTIQLRPLNTSLFSPIVPLGSTLELSFDNLQGDNKDYQYKIEHMTYDWKPSSLSANQYIDGFNQNAINNISNSFNTLQNYTHYTVQIPNQNTIITKSGNYLISILDEDDTIIFTRRCTFYENIVTIGVTVYRSRNTATINKQQTVQFTINHKGVPINAPSQEIKIALLQNNNWNTAIFNLKPQFLKPNQLLYHYTNLTNFWGGNEFLNFDNKHIRSTSSSIAKTIQKNIFHNYLYKNESRATKPYTYNPDINGHFVIRSMEGNDNDTEADYAFIHFSLDSPTPYENKKVYIYGAFNNFELNNENQMTYNEEHKSYEGAILLKQGFYNYLFATEDTEENVNLTEISGSFYQTENKYTVITYYQPFGGMYDRAIGIGNGFFNQNK
ncbi:conserved exported hypothetical protein [Tenacibaculum maritimum]|uniref:type IX secretion system plug protein n=1 Tax=Tenacibaculum maritimum TaxID=107401 RepID=UPI0012E4EA7D|nr:DUF5103 domain-containing protein [Tenacibaculum maritimum]CAA0185239.1 conserved exported hypothetical protein [Tenacibaculum maritimum]